MHIQQPVECIKLYMVSMSERSTFSVREGKQLKMVSLFDLHNNVERYGYVMSSISTLISRYVIVYG